ncbi:class I SAM-dependent methyltransferase [Bdellovibrionota bacterium FG-2]
MATYECGVCGKKNSKLLYKAPSFDPPMGNDPREFDLYQCAHCVVTQIQPLPTPEVLSKYYSPAYYGTAKAKFNPLIETLTKIENKIRASRMLRFLPHHNPKETRILDIGCGRGTFLKTLAKEGYQCTGVELSTFPEPPAAPLPGQPQFLTGEVETLPLALGSFDGISIWHVFEHVRKPSQTLARCHELLNMGGTLMIAVPHFKSFQSRIFRKNWFHLDLPRHLYHFPKGALLSLLNQHGFEILSVDTQGWDQNIFGFIQSAFNSLLFWRPANEWYQILKKQNTVTQKRLPAFARYLGYLAGSVLLLPLAIIENILAVALNRGGSLIVVARKR